MNILLLTDSYPPEIRSASQLMHELATELKERGHSMHIITTRPKYNINQSENPALINNITVENGIEVIRIKSLPLHNTGAILRGLANLLLPVSVYRAGLKHLKKKIDLIIVYSTPLTLGLSAKWLKKSFNAKFVLNLQDIFPQQAIDLGIMRNSLIIKFFEWIEKTVYKSADFIAVHSKGNLEYLINKKGIGRNGIDIVHNWVDHRPFDEAQNTGKYREMYNLKDAFIVLYAGVIGLPQGLDTVIKVAERLKYEKGLIFLIVGDGLKKAQLIRLAEQKNLKNISFQSFVSLRQYPGLVKECNAGLVCLDAQNKTPVVPGKMIGYMAAGIPVVAILNRESDGHQIVAEAKCGFSAVPEEVDKIADGILDFLKNKSGLPQMGKNGREYMLKYFSQKANVDKYEEIFSKIKSLA